VSVSRDTTGLVWDVTGASSRRGFRFNQKELNTTWAELASADAAPAYRAVALLVAAPEQGTTLLRKHLRPVALPPGQHVARLLANLDSDDFATRRKAQSDLETLSEAVEPALRQALKKPASLEAALRIKKVLRRLE